MLIETKTARNRRVLALFDKGVPYATIGRIFHISPTRVKQIVARTAQLPAEPARRHSNQFLDQHQSPS